MSNHQAAVIKYLIDKGISQREFARTLGVSDAAVSQWLKGGIPIRRVRAIELATGGAISRETLFPELFQ